MPYVLKKGKLYLQYYLGIGLGSVNTSKVKLAHKFKSREAALKTANQYNLLYDYKIAKVK